MLESNAHKRPQSWKRPDNNEIGGTSLEYILMTGDDQGDDENNNKVVYDTIQRHNKINMVDPDDGEDRGTCNHCGANVQQINFVMYARRERLVIQKTGILSLQVGAPSVVKKDMLVTTATSVQKKLQLASIL